MSFRNSVIAYKHGNGAYFSIELPSRMQTKAFKEEISSTEGISTKLRNACDYLNSKKKVIYISISIAE